MPIDINGRKRHQWHFCNAERHQKCQWHQWRMMWKKPQRQQRQCSNWYQWISSKHQANFSCMKFSSKFHLDSWTQYLPNDNIQSSCQKKVTVSQDWWLTVITPKVTQRHSSSLKVTPESDRSVLSQFFSQFSRSRSLKQVLIVMIRCEVVDLGTERKKCEFWKQNGRYKITLLGLTRHHALVNQFVLHISDTGLGSTGSTCVK